MRYHRLRAYLPIALDVPKTESTCGRRDRLRKAEISILQEREGKLVILTNRHQCAGCVQALRKGKTIRSCQLHVVILREESTDIGKEKEREEVDERVRQFPVLLQGGPDLV